MHIYSKQYMHIHTKYVHNIHTYIHSDLLHFIILNCNFWYDFCNSISLNTRWKILPYSPNFNLNTTVESITDTNPFGNLMPWITSIMSWFQMLSGNDQNFRYFLSILFTYQLQKCVSLITSQWRIRSTIQNTPFQFLALYFFRLCPVFGRIWPP